MTVYLGEQEEVRIKDILDDSPAAVGGLKKDDILLEIDDVKDLTIEKYLFSF